MSVKNCLDVKTVERKVFINSINSYHGKCLFRQLINDGEETKKKKIKIVGTIDNNANAVPPENAEIISFNNVGELFDKIKICDIVVYDVTETLEQVEQARNIIKCLNNCHKETKCSLFILVSTVGTWAMTDCIDEEDVPITEEDFRSRKPHPNFIERHRVERMAAKLGKIENLSSCVINCGLTYGCGENIFNFIFKAAWLNERHVPVYGCGANVLPMIHVSDLSRIISSVIHSKPHRLYVLAVDNSQHTYMEITQGITKRLSTKNVQMLPYFDAFLNEDLTQIQIDLLSVDLRMASLLKETHDVELDHPDGLISSLEDIVGSYREYRHLQIPKIILLGPTCSGKSTIARHLSSILRAPAFDLDAMRIDPVSEISKKLSFCPEPKDGTNVSGDDGDEEVKEMMKLLEEVGGVKASRPGLQINDELLIKIMKRVMNSKLCSVHGFILDGFPETIEQATHLFQETSEAPNTEYPPDKLESKFVFDLIPSSSYYVDSILCLPESSFQDLKLTPELLYKKISEFYSSNNHKEVIDYLERCSFQLTDIQISTICSETLSMILRRLPSEDLMKQDVDICKLNSSGPINVAAVDADEKFMEEQEMCSKIKTKTYHMVEEEKYCLDQSSSVYYKLISDKLLQRCATGIIACHNEDPDNPVEFLAKCIFEGFECQEY